MPRSGVRWPRNGGLPDTIQNPIAWHHDFERVRKGDWNTVIVYISDRSCKLAGLGVGGGLLEFSKNFVRPFAWFVSKRNKWTGAWAEVKRQLKKMSFLFDS